MSYNLDEMLVVGVASSALFDLEESDNIFRTRGEVAYRQYQEEHIDDTLAPGGAFPFIKRLLSLNDLAKDEKRPLVEVIILSRNDPETGLRVMRSVQAHDLPISRAIFMQGRSPFDYMEALNMSLFLSEHEEDVRRAVERGLPAGRIVGRPAEDPTGRDLRVAFDFDGVLANDESEQIMQDEGLEAFHSNEVDRLNIPLGEGMMPGLLRGLNRIQDIEEGIRKRDSEYNRRLHVSIVTARNAPSHERVVRTLQKWGVRVNDAFFLGGVEKARILKVLRPHIFFDDQIRHIEGVAGDVPSVHVPFGEINQPGDRAAPDDGAQEEGGGTGQALASELGSPTQRGRMDP